MAYNHGRALCCTKVGRVYSVHGGHSRPVIRSVKTSLIPTRNQCRFWSRRPTVRSSDNLRLAMRLIGVNNRESLGAAMHGQDLLWLRLYRGEGFQRRVHCDGFHESRSRSRRDTELGYVHGHIGCCQALNIGTGVGKSEYQGINASPQRTVLKCLLAL